MSRVLKSLMACSCLFAGFFIAADFNKVEAAYGRWGAYDTERGAWGGNGGWWGDGRSDWYGDGTAYDYHGGGYNGGYYSDPYYYSNGYNNNYYYDNSYPYGQNYYGGPGIGAGAGVDGAGVYFNVR